MVNNQNSKTNIGKAMHKDNQEAGMQPYTHS